MIGLQIRKRQRQVSESLVDSFRAIPVANISDCMARMTAGGARLRPMHGSGRLAGPAQMAGRFLEEDASLDEVRTVLLAARAEAEPEIAPHHPQPGRSSAARPWGEIVARTFKLKG